MELFITKFSIHIVILKYVYLKFEKHLKPRFK